MYILHIYVITNGARPPAPTDAIRTCARPASVKQIVLIITI